MIRLILALFGKVYEPCKSCETLKQQLEFANAEKRELLETLLNLAKPNVVVASEGETKILQPTTAGLGNFNRRRKLLEDSHKRREEIIKTSPFVARLNQESDKQPAQHISPETISEMESKLGLKENAS